MNCKPRTIKSLLQPPQIRPQPEIEILIAHVLRQPRESVLAHPEQTLTFWQLYQIKRLLRKRARGIPLAYLTGHKEFFGLEFIVNKHVLIPRPETEMLVELTTEQLKQSPLLLGEGGRGEVVDSKNERIALIDIGTGSGCIPISIMKTLKHENMKTLTCYATDISRPAIRVAKKNAKRHEVGIVFLHGNLLDPIIKKSKIANLKSKIIITANLSYLAKSWYKSEPSIQHEPREALIADEIDGLSLYRKLLKQINTFAMCYRLQITCFMEFDPRQSAAIGALIQTLFPNAQIKISKDLAGHDRIVELTTRPII